MELFNSLMIVFLILILINIVLMLSLWRSTKSSSFLILIFHWVFLLVAYYFQKVFVNMELYISGPLTLLPNMGVHLSLIAVFFKMINLEIPWRKIFLIPIFVFIIEVIMFWQNASTMIVALPLMLAQSSLYFYAVYKAYRYRKELMTFSLKAIAIIFILTGIHIFDYYYFHLHIELLAIGFAIAFAFEMAISILFPAAIIEKLSTENERLKNKIEFQAKLTHTAKMVALGEMAGGIGHELNNPLMILSLSLEKAKLAVTRDMEVLPLLDKSMATIARMSKIISGLLTFSREDGPAGFSKVIIQDLVSDTLNFCLEKFKKNGIRFDLKIPETRLICLGNSLQLSQVVLNLLNNAYDATLNIEDKWIQLVINDLGKDIELSIIDSGKGIRPEVVEKMFNPFFTTKDVGMGTGLGLSVAKGILETHSGKLYFDPTSSNTKFTLILPKYERP